MEPGYIRLSHKRWSKPKIMIIRGLTCFNYPRRGEGGLILHSPLPVMIIMINILIIKSRIIIIIIIIIITS